MIAISKSHTADEEESEEDIQKSELQKYTGMILGIVAAMGFAVNSVYNRKLKNLDYTDILVYYGVVGVGLSSIFILIEGAI